MSFVLGTSLLAVVTALACALPGVFIVLRKNSMLVDAISHAVFPGIVVGYLFSRDLDSPILIAGAALAGLLVVLGSEWLSRTGLITGDAPQGLIFPALFSIGVILITMNFSNVHLDTHTVLVGDLNLASFEQFAVQGIPVAPVYLVLMLGMLALKPGRPLALPIHHARRAEIISGIIGGLYGGISGIWGPPLIVYLLSVGAPKDEQMRVQGVVFLMGAVVLTFAHLGSGVLNAQTLPLSAVLVVPGVVGMVVGLRVHDRLDVAQFRRWTLVLLVFSGLNLVRRGLELLAS